MAFSWARDSVWKLFYAAPLNWLHAQREAFMRSLLFCLLALLALPAAAQFYKYTDANGNTAYSDQPPQGVKAQTVELPPLNSIQGPQHSPPPAPAQPAAPSAQPPYAVLELTDLPNDEALRANNGTFTVGVHLEPRLASSDTLQLLIDGQPYGQPSNVPRLQVLELDRGDHSIAVQVVSGGNVIQQSATQNITVQRVHLGPASNIPRPGAGGKP